MRIHGDFTGGNIRVTAAEGDTVFLENEMRDTQGDWFYWAFCAEGAAGRTVTFRFQKNRLGRFGPAVSRDREHWHWLGSRDGDSFTYTFAADEERVYFAHDMLYHPARFQAFAAARGWSTGTLCVSGRGRAVPCLTLGEGEKTILLTARHHACESTGSYVLEGVLSSLGERMPPGFRVFCAPFVDYDGVLDGDQGKNRAPYDHNRDYDPAKAAIYPACAELRRLRDAENVVLGFDFHSPWHSGGENDKCYIVQKDHGRLARLERFGRIFESCMTPGAFRYAKSNDHPPDTGWNREDSPTAAYWLLQREAVDLACTLETAYFGEADNVFTAERGIETGRCFAEAICRYIAERQL